MGARSEISKLDEEVKDATKQLRRLPSAVGLVIVLERLHHHLKVMERNIPASGGVFEPMMAEVKNQHRKVVEQLEELDAVSAYSVAS